MSLGGPPSSKAARISDKNRPIQNFFNQSSLVNLYKYPETNLCKMMIDISNALCYTIVVPKEQKGSINMNVAVMNAIQTFVAMKLNRPSVTWEEVEEIYDSGEYPEINETIDYILG